MLIDKYIIIYVKAYTTGYNLELIIHNIYFNILLF